MAKSTGGRWDGTWTGGRIWRDADGHRTYHIRRSIGGRRYDLSTRATTRAGAEEQLRKFEADPAGYQPGGAEPIYLDTALAESFLAWSASKGNSPGWLRLQRTFLAWWGERLAGVDLRRTRLGDIRAALDRPDGKKSQPQRVAVIKCLYSWLRAERNAIETVEDPTFGKLKIPQARPAQWTKSKAISRETLGRVIQHLGSERWRDLLKVLMGCGCHVSELERFARAGSVEPLPRDGKAEGAVAALLFPQTKAGSPLRVAVSGEVAAAAGRVLALGSFDRQALDKAIRSACRAAGVEPFGPGVLRHSVATLAINSGASPAQVAAFLNHRSPRTTLRFYATLATPVKVPALL